MCITCKTCLMGDSLSSLCICSDCQWETAESNGTIASSNYPSNYHSFSNCSLWILAPAGSKIGIAFDALQLEMDAKCLYDFLQIEEIDPSSSSE